LFKIISGNNQTLKLAGFLPMMGTARVRIHRAVTGGSAPLPYWT
jgi:chromosome partitioning protein